MCGALAACLGLGPGLAVAAAGPLAPPAGVPVLSVTHEAVRQTRVEKVCWQRIVSDRERAQRQRAGQSWLTKHWKPIAGGVLGGLAGFAFTRNYGPDSQRWVYPTVLGGVAAGAVAGPGFVGGAEALGWLTYAYWPGKLPLVAVSALVGGILGNGLVDLLFPDDPSADLLQPPRPGQFLADQQFYLETTCAPRVRSVTTRETPYRVTYRHQGELRSALVKYYPGERIVLGPDGQPVNALDPSISRSRP